MQIRGLWKPDGEAHPLSSRFEAKLYPTILVPITTGMPTMYLTTVRACVRCSSDMVLPFLIASIPGRVALSSDISCPNDGPDSETLCCAPPKVVSSMIFFRLGGFVVVDAARETNVVEPRAVDLRRARGNIVIDGKRCSREVEVALQVEMVM